MVFVEFVDDAILRGKVGELQRHFSLLVNLPDVSKGLIYRVADRGCFWHFCASCFN